MKKPFQLLFILSFVTTSCKKDPAFVPTPPQPTKWEKIPGNYKVYDTSGVHLYDMRIKFYTQLNYYFFTFINFDNGSNLAIYQDQSTPYTNTISIGNCNGIYDAHSNRWNTTDLGSYAYDLFFNDTIELNFEKDNGPYWQEDDTTYHHIVVKQIAVKE